MENFLSKEDCNFYDYHFSLFSERYCLKTNNGFFKEEPILEERHKITHILTAGSYDPYIQELRKYTFLDYPKLKYLEYNGDCENIDYSIFDNLKILIIPSDLIQDTNLLNLPNIEILIFRDIIESFFCGKIRKYDFMLPNMPISLKTLIFDGSHNIYDKDFSKTYTNNCIINFLKVTMESFKLPFDCKVYFIDYDKKIYRIIE